MATPAERDTFGLGNTHAKHEFGFGSNVTPATPTFTSEKWEEQKDHIHEPFVEQPKTHIDVVRILKERHGFDVG